jgi:hypothetical protein
MSWAMLAREGGCRLDIEGRIGMRRSSIYKRTVQRNCASDTDTGGCLGQTKQPAIMPFILHESIGSSRVIPHMATRLRPSGSQRPACHV